MKNSRKVRNTMREKLVYESAKIDIFCFVNEDIVTGSSTGDLGNVDLGGWDVAAKGSWDR